MKLTSFNKETILVPQRDSPNFIDHPSILVYDIMLPHLGNQYKINQKLNQRIFRPPGFESTKIEAIDIIEDLGMKYLKKVTKKKLEQALECYKLSSFSRFRFNLEYALHPNQIIPKSQERFLKLDSEFEDKLSLFFDELTPNENKSYYNWVDTLRNMSDDFNYKWGRGYYGNNIDFAKLAFRLGHYEEGLWAIKKITQGMKPYQKEQGDFYLAIFKKAEDEKSEQLIDVKYIEKKLKKNPTYKESL